MADGSRETEFELASPPAESVLDDESLYEETPVDGYFAQRPHPRQRFVENSSVDADAQTKAREAAAQRAGDAQPAPRVHQQSADPSSTPVWPQQHAPIVDGGPPPPDYASATANWSSPRSSSRPLEAATVGSIDHHPYVNDYGTVPSEVRSVPGPPSEDREDLSGSRSNHSNAEVLDDRPWPLGNRSNPFSSAEGFGRHWPFGPRHQSGSYNRSFPPRDASGHNRSSHLHQHRHHTPHHHPQSMRDSRAHEDDLESATEETGLLFRKRRRARRQNRSWSASCCKPMVIVNLLLASAVVVLVVLLATSKLDMDKIVKGPSTPVDDGSGRAPPDYQDGHPSHGSANASFPHPDTEQCTFDSESRVGIFDFEEPTEFSFIEMLDGYGYLSGGVSGSIRVVAQPELDVDIRVWLSYATTQPWQVTGIANVKSETGLLLEMPPMERSSEGYYTQKACLDLYVQIEVRPGLVLQDWEIATANLDVYIDDGLFDLASHDDASSALSVENQTIFKLVRGRLDAQYWSSRETVIDLVSGSVKGSYALRDKLSIHTHTGSIDVDVVPKKADPNAPAPAAFAAISTSGSVKAVFPMSGDIPARQYLSTAESSSGSVSGRYLLGEETTLQTISGSINAELLPHYARSTKSSLTAQSRSGSIRLHTHRMLDEDIKKPWVHSVHKAVTSSGTVALEYEDWEGVFEGQTISGHISIKGKDFRIISNEKNSPVYKRVVAVKGTEGGHVSVATHSGSISMKADELES